MSMEAFGADGGESLGADMPEEAPKNRLINGDSPQLGELGREGTPEAGIEASLTERAIALYAPPFCYGMGYIHDSRYRMVADDSLPEPERLEPGMALRVRGWGHIQKHENPADLQDEVGRVIAQALTEFWERRMNASEEA